MACALLFRPSMTIAELLALHAGDAATRAAITDLVLSEPFRELPPSYRSLIIAYVVAAKRRARRMAWSLRSLLDEPGFVAANGRTRIGWIYLFGEEVLEDDATEPA